MIALNELVKNQDEFEKKYKLMGYKVNLEKIMALEKIARNIQMELEKDRANCNKLCTQVPELISAQGNVSKLIEAINNLDGKINKASEKLNKLTQKLNRKLSKLPNLPVFTNVMNEQIETQLSKTTSPDFLAFLEEFAPISPSNIDSKTYLKQNKDVIFEKSKMPMILSHNNSYTILCSKSDLNAIFEKLLNFIKCSSKLIIKKSIRQLNHSSKLEYLAVLSSNQKISLNLVGEFYSREYKNKYFETQEDMTRFVNQIEIKLY